jgi:hypothetical protein
MALFVPVLLAATSQTRRDQIDAATARAVDRLRTQIAREEVGRNLTVGDLLKATRGNDILTKTIQRAQMIGGPRWIDEQTCQVRLEIAGPRVAAALLQAVSVYPKESPIPPEVLAARLKQWDGRTFAATATSTGAATAEQARPDEESPAWAAISDEARQQAITAAKQNVAGRTMHAIEPVLLSEGRTVADALADAKVKWAIEQWLMTRPVTQVEFRDDLQVAVTLATPPDELADALIAASGAAEADRARIRQEIGARVAAVSRGSARAGVVDVKRATAAAPLAPPWTNDQLEADGTATAKNSPLLAARAAQAEAQRQLRQKVEALPLNEQQTIAQAAKQDPRLAEAVARVIAGTRASKVDYQPDGSARVRVSLQLSDLWDAIAAGL